jgi:hypothetical protein
LGDGAATGSHRLRAIGHPRCGSAYVAQALLHLGLDVAHERLGRDGMVSWIHNVDDLAPPFQTPPVLARDFAATIAFVRDPLTAIPFLPRGA